MAQGQGALPVQMRLCLQEADAGVQLGGHVEVLIVHGKDADEGGAVSGDLGYVGV